MDSLLFGRGQIPSHALFRHFWALLQGTLSGLFSDSTCKTSLQKSLLRLFSTSYMVIFVKVCVFHTSQKSIAIHLPLVLQYASNLHCSIFGKSGWLWSPGCSPIWRQNMMNDNQMRSGRSKKRGTEQLTPNLCCDRFLPAIDPQTPNQL